MRKRLLLGALALVVGCAQALDDGYYGSSADGAVKDTSTSTDTAAKDTGSPPKVDSTTPIDTYVEDTWVEDTYVEDTFVEDTGTVVVDTGPVTGTCSYCATGICKSPLEDYSCLINCLIDGHFDCNYDTTSPSPCTCTD